MKYYNKIIIYSLLVLGSLMAYSSHLTYRALNFKNEAIKAWVAQRAGGAQNEAQVAQKQALMAFTAKVMDLPPKTHLSEAKKEVLINKIVNIIQSNIDGIEAQEQFISMLKVESGFDNNRTSSVGAVGISQIMQPTFNANIVNCGIKAEPNDIKNEDINIFVGSCYFSQLLIQNDFNPRLASLSYNGGQGVVKQAKQLKDINKESSNYLLKVSLVKELAEQ